MNRVSRNKENDLQNDWRLGRPEHGNKGRAFDCSPFIFEGGGVLFNITFRA